MKGLLTNSIIVLVLCGCDYNQYEQFIVQEWETDTMTVDFSNDATLTGRITPADTDYPLGTYIDRQGGVADTGTPTRALERQDWDGFRQAILAAGKYGDGTGGTQAVSGDPDTATASETLAALFENYGQQMVFRPSAATEATKGNYGFVNVDGVSSRVLAQAAPGSSYTMQTRVEGKSIAYGGIRPGDDNSLYHAFSEYEIDQADLSTSGGIVTYFPSGGITLTGIPADSPVNGVWIRLFSSAGNTVNIPMSAIISNGATDILVSVAKGVDPGAALVGYTQARLIIDYDPSSVD